MNTKKADSGETFRENEFEMNTKKSWEDLTTPQAMLIRFLRALVVSLFVALIEGTHRYIQTGTTGVTPEAWVIVAGVTISVEMIMIWRFFRR